MNNKTLFLAVAAAFGIFAACDPVAESYSGRDVFIEMKVLQLSSGFVEVDFKPDRPAYYLTSIDKKVYDIDPKDYSQQFMDLALDSAYVEFCQWRHAHLLKGEKYVADFPSHTLQYGETTLIQNFLEPDTDYWLYCFVVDAESNKANGELFVETFHTTKESIFKTIRFAYRVSGEWDYVYPYDTETGTLVTNVPWVGDTVDSLKLRQLGYAAPGHYFDEVFTSLDPRGSRVLTGIYAHQNNGVGDGTSTTCFEKGHTYYTAMATLDGKRNECFDIYRFRWDGPDTELIFEDKDNTLGAY